MEDLKLIKKYYGEKMSHLCRELFPTILEQEAELFKIISNNFAFSKYLYDDIINNNLKYNFKNYIYGISDNKTIRKRTTKSPKELLNEVGYDLYECTNYKEVDYFKKYYTKEERLCTFKHIEERLENNYIFFAIKKDIDNIKRKNFKKPERQDLYGTSAISIQFTKGDINTLSIKNRYNHNVPNPDATFSNNLDNIIDGLTQSFNEEYNLNINGNISIFEIPGYVKAKDKKYYKYNYEIHNIYYCPDNIIIDNFEVKKYDKERYIIFDYFILDMKEKTIKLYDNKLYDSFINDFKQIDKIEISKEKEEKKIIINDGIIITLDRYNNIIKYQNNISNHIYSDYLYYNKSLIEINLPNVKEIDDNFLFYNNSLSEITLPCVLNIGSFFLDHNVSISMINLPKIEKIGSVFLRSNQSIKKIDLPNVKKIGDHFLSFNQSLSLINLPKVEEIKEYFLNHSYLLSIELPNVKKIGDNFLAYNKILINVDLPNVREIGHSFLNNNKSLQRLNIPKVESIDAFCLDSSILLEELIISESIVYYDSKIRRFLGQVKNIKLCDKDDYDYLYSYIKLCDKDDYNYLYSSNFSKPKQLVYKI